MALRPLAPSLDEALRRGVIAAAIPSVRYRPQADLFVPCEGCGKYVQGPPRLTPARLEQGGFSWQAAPHDCREDCRS